jgi:hypothetical protein
VPISWLVDVNGQCDVHVVLGVYTLQPITPSRTVGGLTTSCSDVDQHTSALNSYTQLSIVHAYSKPRGFRLGVAPRVACAW